MSEPLPLQIWSDLFCKRFDAMPRQVQSAIESKIDRLARNLNSSRMSA